MTRDTDERRSARTWWQGAFWLAPLGIVAGLTAQQAGYLRGDYWHVVKYLTGPFLGVLCLLYVHTVVAFAGFLALRRHVDLGRPLPMAIYCLLSCSLSWFLMMLTQSAEHLFDLGLSLFIGAAQSATFLILAGIGRAVSRRGVRIRQAR